MKQFNLNETLTEAGWTEDTIQKIYRGGDHVCRCGCAGKYYVPDCYINIPIATDPRHNKCFCLYREA